MRHLVAGRKLKRTASHRKAMLSNMAASLIEFKRLTTTEAKAKELRPFVESIITKAKRALAREKAGLLPQGQTIDIHSRRMVARFIPKAAIIQELFDSVAPVVEERPGGYVRIVKLGHRRGDAARMAIVELVDWAEERDGRFGGSRKRKKASATSVEQVKAERAAAALSESLQATAVALESMNQQAEEAEVIADDTTETTVVENVVAEAATEETASTTEETSPAADESAASDTASAEEETKA